jgi:hypothetical protein
MIKKKPEPKAEWVKPQLTIYGTIEKITQFCDKTVGPGDGLMLQGVGPIRCAS